MINKLSQQIYENAVLKGFHKGQKNLGEMLCLIHSEVSEALEADREDRYAGYHNIDSARSIESDILFINYFASYVKDTFEDELADIMIRVMDLAAHKGVDLEAHIAAKMRYNSLREPKHGKKY